jgi:hypothetical protein
VTELRDIVVVNPSNRPAAIRLDDSLAGNAAPLIDVFTPTRSAIGVLRHLQRAVLSDARKEQRAMVWFGVYGSGKSHLGVVVGHLLAYGCGAPEMQDFLGRLASQGETTLRREIESTFPPADQPHARPYLVVSVYASDAPDLLSNLLEGLYRAIESVDGLEPGDILPKTEYAAARERLAKILEHEPAHAKTPLSHWGIECAALNPEELDVELQDVSPEALQAFKQWHKKVSAGAEFDPRDFGGKGVLDAYIEAADALVQGHGYQGIAVLWDEFGYAIESMLRQQHRKPLDEIFALQDFVESVCAPRKGHTLFIALTHKSLREYGRTADAAEDVRHRLETIEGRFTALSVELRASEAEGYHLLGDLTAPTAQGHALLQGSAQRGDALAKVCAAMPVFGALAGDMRHILDGCYPMHPVTAAGLFKIAAQGVYAQASRTVFTFFDNLGKEQDIFDAAVDPDALYGAELIRLPTLVPVYRKEIYDEVPDLADAYRDAVAKVKQGFANPDPKRDILSVLLLSRVLGEDFQPTEAFLAATLYDAEVAPAQLIQDLEDLSAAGLIWRRQADTPVWELEGGGGTQIGGLIEEEQANLPERSFAQMLAEDEELGQDLLPQIGRQDLEPSHAGIVRSFQVGLLEDPRSPGLFDAPLEGLSAQVFFALPPNDARAVDAAQAVAALEAPELPTYVWLPTAGFGDLLPALQRYRAILNLLQGSGLGDGPRRQLRSKSDEVRLQLRDALNQRLGREALSRREVRIRRIGDADEDIAVSSWHGFVEYLEQRVAEACSKEVKVRAMNANRMILPEGQRRIRGMHELLEKILEFDTLRESVRNDLFGMQVTSEIAAVIDGTLGVYTNGLMVKRASGWDIKTPDEADGAVGELLRLIRDRLMDKRKKDNSIAELRTELMRPPFGMPVAIMPIFTAVAIRKDHARLKWVNKDGAFANLLWDAFQARDGYRLRFDTFKQGQHKVLVALYQALPRRPDLAEQSDPDEQARATVKALRDYVSGLPEAIRKSSKLSEKAKSLFEFVRRPGQDAQSIADCLIKLLKSDDADAEQKDVLRDLFLSVDRVADERSAMLWDVVERFSRGEEQWQSLLQALRDQGKDALAVAVARVRQKEDDGADRVASILSSGKRFAECSDMEVGLLAGELKAIFETALRPAALRQPPPPPAPPPDAASTGGEFGPGKPLPPHTGADAADHFRDELKHLWAKYRDQLGDKRLSELVAMFIKQQPDNGLDG